MEEFQGTLECKGSSYRVAGVLEVRVRDGIKKWSGYFVAPEGADFAAEIENEDPHKLSLDDNRFGDVIFSTIDHDETGATLVDFQGRGPLQ